MVWNRNAIQSLAIKRPLAKQFIARQFARHSAKQLAHRPEVSLPPLQVSLAGDVAKDAIKLFGNPFRRFESVHALGDAHRSRLACPFIKIAEELAMVAMR